MAAERPVSHEAARADALLHGIGSTPEQAREASLVLAGHATGADELRRWLEILGLRDYQSAHRMPCGRPSKAKGAPKLNAPRCGTCGYLVTSPGHTVMCDA